MPSISAVILISLIVPAGVDSFTVFVEEQVTLIYLSHVKSVAEKVTLKLAISI